MTRSATSSPATSSTAVARLVATKDLRIELRSRVLINQVLPFAAIVLVLFAFALDSDDLLERVAPGLVWLATLFSMLVVVQRSFAVEAADGALDALRTAGIPAQGIFFGKAVALTLQLVVLEALLFFAAFVLYSSRFDAGGLALLITSALAASCGLGLVGTLYGGLTTGTKGRESLLPLLLLPVVAPVLIGATRATEAALGVGGISMREGWAWVALLAVYALLFAIGGSISFGPLVDDSVLAPPITPEVVVTPPATVKNPTGTRVTRVLGIVTLVGLAWFLLFGLVLSPDDAVQRKGVRILYIHVPSAWLAYLAFIMTAVSSAAYLWKRTRSLTWDRIAGASAEVGVLFMGITLLTGSLWGRISWGVYWVWDSRVTTTVFLFVTYLGYLAVRGLGGSHHQRARRSAVVALLAVLEIPLVHFSVEWWRPLHQQESIAKGKLENLMLFSLFIGVIVFTLLYVWLVIHRQRVMAMQDALDDHGLEFAIAERREEASL